MYKFKRRAQGTGRSEASLAESSEGKAAERRAGRRVPRAEGLDLYI